MVSIGIVIKDYGHGGVHKQVSLYAGPDADHRAHCGQVTMREDEAEDLKRRIEAGEVIEAMPKHAEEEETKE